MSFAVSFFLGSALALSLLLLATFDLELDIVSSCARLAVSDSSGGKCSFCKHNASYHSGLYPHKIFSATMEPPSQKEQPLDLTKDFRAPNAYHNVS